MVFCRMSCVGSALGSAAEAGSDRSAAFDVVLDATGTEEWFPLKPANQRERKCDKCDEGSVAVDDLVAEFQPADSNPRLRPKSKSIEGT